MVGIIAAPKRYSDMRNSQISAFLSAIALTAFGCGGGGSGGSDGISFVVPVTVGQVAGKSLVVTDGSGDSLTIDSVEIVVEELEFEIDESTDDCADGATEDDECEEIELGPFLIRLNLDGSDSTTISANVAPGLYEEVEFEVHAAESDDDDEEDNSFINDHPDFDGISVKVLGSFNATSFTFESDVEAEQEIEFSPPLEVLEGEAADVTVTVDVETWFVDGGGNLIDPDTAGEGGANESIVENNIANSFDAFEDEDDDESDDD
jgi:hypothetical protein